MIDFARTYQWLCDQASDINEHLPILYDYGSRVDHITEFGVRYGVSTIAWLYANPKKLVSYDINPLPGVIADIVLLKNFKFELANVLDIKIEETDLLFIDTYHTYGQLSQELALHGNKSRLYIVLHDTEIFGSRGMDGTTPGLLAAIGEFMTANPWWYVTEEFENNNGLTILKNMKGAT